MQWATLLISLKYPILAPGLPYDHLLLISQSSRQKQLISHLVHGCSIGYHGPQFLTITKHLRAHPYSALTLLTKIEAGHIFESFDSPPLPYLWCCGLEAIPKHGCSWPLILRHTVVCLAVKKAKWHTSVLFTGTAISTFSAC